MFTRALQRSLKSPCFAARVYARNLGTPSFHLADGAAAPPPLLPAREARSTAAAGGHFLISNS